MRARGAIGEDCTTASPVVARVDYAYDANGNRSRQTERGMDPATQRLGDPEETGYAYDAVDRLVGVLYPGGAASLYGLDAAGNRVREVELASAAAGDVVPAAWSTRDPAKVVRDVTATFNRRTG